MQAIDERTVDLTEDELAVRKHQDQLLDEGKGIEEAAEIAVHTHNLLGRDPLDPQFVRWIRDEPLERIDGPTFDSEDDARLWVLRGGHGTVWTHEITTVRIEAEGFVWALMYSDDLVGLRWVPLRRVA